MLECTCDIKVVAGFSASGCFSAPGRRWMRAMARLLLPGAEVTRGNWCDEHVWPPLPPLHHNHHHHTCATNMEHASPPQPCTTGVCGKCLEQSRLWRPVVATISRVTKGVERAIALCRQTVRSEITFTLQDILLNPL